MKFEELSSRLLVESRGIFHPDKISDIAIYNDSEYTLADNGQIDNFELWKSGKNNIKYDSRLKGKTPKYYAKFENNKDLNDIIYLVGSNKTTVPKIFDFHWPQGKLKTVQTDLKPNTFAGITDRYLSLENLRSILFNSIDDRTDINNELKSYLKSLYDHYYKNTPIVNAEAGKINQNNVLKDFAEIIGVVWRLNEINDTTHSLIFLPHKGNYPLIDSLIVDKDKKEIKISSKSGSTGNTVKGSDLINIINELPKAEQTKLKKQYKDEYKLLELSSKTKESVVESTLNIFKHMVPKFKEHFKELDKLKKMKSKDILTYKSPEITKFIEKIKEIAPPYKNIRKGKEQYLDTAMEAYAHISRYIDKETKSMKFKELSNYIINGRVLYIIAKSMNADGSINFKVSSETNEVKEAWLRYKDGLGRIQERLGIQFKF